MTRQTSKTHETTDDEKLRFCSNCHVSIAVTEIRNGSAKRTGTGAGGVWCTLCARAGTGGRRARRAVLEQEFADDAPIPDPSPLWFRLRKAVVRLLPIRWVTRLAAARRRNL